MQTGNQPIYQRFAHMIEMSPKGRTFFGISGPGGSGKTTLAKIMAHHLGPERCQVIDLDCFCLPRTLRRERGTCGYGPSAFFLDYARYCLRELKEGQSSLLPVYNSKTGTATGYRRVDPKPITLISGVPVLYDELNDLIDTSVFLYASEETQLSIRLVRDITERDYTPQEVVANMIKFKKDYDLYLGPTMERASVVVDVDAHHRMSLTRVDDRFSGLWDRTILPN